MGVDLAAFDERESSGAGLEGEGAGESVRFADFARGLGHGEVEGDGANGLGALREASDECVPFVRGGILDVGEDGEGVVEGLRGGEGGGFQEFCARGRVGLEESREDEVGLELFDVEERSAFGENRLQKGEHLN